MMIVILLLACLIYSHQTSAMLGSYNSTLPSTSLTPNHNASSVESYYDPVSHTQLSHAEIASLPIAMRAQLVQETVLRAIEQSDAQKVTDYFSEWKHWIAPWHYYQAAVATALLHAAQLPALKTGKIVNYLLTETNVNLKDIEKKPDDLLHAAIKNEHIPLIVAIDRAYDEPYTTIALALSIGSADTKDLQTLINAGVKPYADLPTLGKTGMLTLALRTFWQINASTSLEKRLEVLDMLLDHAVTDDIPAVFTTDLCHIPAKIRTLLAQRLNNKFIVAQLCASDIKDTQL